MSMDSSSSANESYEILSSRHPVIPRLIHQFWMQPNKDHTLPDGIIDNVQEWKELNPSYMHKLWDISSIISLLRSTGKHDYVGAIEACRLPAMQSDLIRLALLSEFGGFWADLKIRPRKPIDDKWLHFEAVLIEHAPDNPDYPDDHLVNSFIGSTASSLLISEVLSAAVCNVDKRIPGSIFNITGANVIRNHLRKEGRAKYKLITLDKIEVWQNFIQTTHDEYNRNGFHWSIRQYQEPLYIDTNEINYRINL